MISSQQIEHLIIVLRGQTECADSNLKFQIGISSSGWGGRRTPPYAFAEQGVAMLMILSHEELTRKIRHLENKYDSQFKVVFDAIRQLIEPPKKHKQRLGF